MGWWSDFTGKTGADAAKAAAADTYSKQQSAIARLLGYGDELKGGYDNIGASYQPYVNTANRLAGASNDALYNLTQNPDSVRALPSYQFDQQEGQRAVDRSAAARGMDASGRTLKDLTRFGTGLSDQTYGNQLTRLLGLNLQGFSQGMSALGAQNSAYGAGLQGQYGARATAYNGDMARLMALDASIRFGETPPQPPDVEPAPVVVSTPKSPMPKPLVKSKTLWASIAAGMTTAGSAFTAALSDWRVWCAVIVLALLAYVVWEQNGKPDIRGLVR